MKTPKTLFCALVLGFLSAPGLLGQILVFDLNEKATLFGEGKTSKQGVLGKWIVCLCSDRFYRIEIFPATKSYITSDQIESIFSVTGPKRKSQWVLFDSFMGENAFFSWSLSGTEKVSSIGGRYGLFSFPSSMKGQIFSVFLAETILNNTVRQGTINLKLNMKETQAYNNRNLLLEDAVAIQIGKYRSMGFISAD
jgi:hypothetical protein